jgi:Cytochrome oxidase complex assembly protein 1
MGGPERRISRRKLIGCIGCGAVLSLTAIVAFAALVAGGVFHMLRSTDPYQLGMTQLRHHEQALDALGTPIEEGWIPGGSIRINGPFGEAHLSIPVSGPKAKGTLYVEATKRAGEWQFQTLQLKLASGRRIDLLGSSPSR